MQHLQLNFRQNNALGIQIPSRQMCTEEEEEEEEEDSFPVDVPIPQSRIQVTCLLNLNPICR